MYIHRGSNSHHEIERFSGAWYIDNNGEMMVEVYLYLSSIYSNFVNVLSYDERPRRHWVSENDVVQVNKR